MTKEEFNLAMVAIEKDAYDKKTGLCKKYVMENAIAKRGDIVTDGADAVAVEGVLSSLMGDIFYHGPVVKKDLTPRSRRVTTVVYEGRPGFKILKKAGE